MHRLVRRRSEGEQYIPPRNPFQVFMLCLCVVASLPLLQGDAVSATLEKALPNSTVIMWGYALMLGSAMALIGLLMPDKRAIFGLLLERAGLILVGGAAGIYTFVVYRETGNADGVRYALSLQIAYALACFWRCVQITRALRWSLKNVEPNGGS